MGVAEDGGQFVNNRPGRLARADRRPRADRLPVKLTHADGDIHWHTDSSCSQAPGGAVDEPSTSGRCRGGHSICPSPPPLVHGVETQPRHAPAWTASAATICGRPTAPAAHSDDDFSWLVGEFLLTHLDAGTAYEPAYSDSKAGSEEFRDEPAMIIEHLEEEELINDTVRLDWWLSQPEWTMLWMLSRHSTCHDAAVWRRARAWEHAQAQIAWAQQEARRFCSPSVSSQGNVRFAPY